MRLRRSIRLSFAALFTQRLRTSLALASVGAGVASVLMAGALGAGAAQAVRLRIQGMGANLLVVRPAQVKKLVARKAVKGVVTTLRLEDAADVEAVSIVAQAAPAVEAPVRVKGDGAAMKTKVIGTTSAFQSVRLFRLRSGRFLTADDDRLSARVAVLGARVADSLFPDNDPVGRQLRVRDVPFEVVGVLAAKGVQADGDEDNQVVVPIRTALRRVFNTTSLSAIFVGVTEDAAMTAAETEIGAVLHEGHRLGREGQPDDFEIQNSARMFALQQKTADSLGLLTTGLAALALLVGGAGILALMLMSVKERTGEIGLRMAVGATPRDILVQFLLEATTLSLAGWILGLGVGALGALVLALATSWKVGVPAGALLSSFGMALAIGLGFGALPAGKASLIPPIEALVAE
jgi:putative ABC transport system permease protein